MKTRKVTISIIIAITAFVFIILLVSAKNSKETMNYAPAPTVYVDGVAYYTNTVPADLEDKMDLFKKIGEVENEEDSSGSFAETESYVSDSNTEHVIMSDYESASTAVYYSSDYPELIYTKNSDEIHVYSAKLAKCILLNYNDELYIYFYNAEIENYGSLPPFDDFRETDRVISYSYTEYIPRGDCESNKKDLKGQKIYVSDNYTDYLYTYMFGEKALFINVETADIPDVWWGLERTVTIKC